MKNLIRKLINRETIVYLIFGVLTTVVNYIIFWLCRRIFIPVLIANIISWVGAVIFAFITNKLFVFESKSFRLQQLIPEIIGFVSARVLSFLFEEGFLAVTYYLGMNEYVAKLIASVVVIIVNYFEIKFLIFKKKETKVQEDLNDGRNQS